MNKILVTMILSFFAIPHLSAQETLHIETFKGKDISTYVEDITDLSLTVYREYPYLYEGTVEEYLPFIEYYSHSERGIACILFDNEKPVGVAIGMPMSEMREKYKQPFVSSRPQENSDEIFYLGEFLLLKEYRAQGFGKQIYMELESAVKEENFKKICFCEIDDTADSTPENCQPIDGFWQKMGFEVCEDITVSVYWRNVYETADASHHLTYWMKSISE